ncbi:MAG: flagellar basal body protein FliL [Gammaproteobacteria bacterium]|nr:flagellar basal body protein FliL [Gammaproteobacteria bacterium]
MRPLMLLSLIITLSISITVSAANSSGQGNSALYYSLSPSLITNVMGKANYMRCDVQLMTKDETFLEEIQRHNPALRHELLLLLGDQDGQELKAVEGKEMVRKAALIGVQGIMKSITGHKMIDDLYFTSYFVQ